MAAFTKRQKRDIAHILYNMERAQKYIMRDDVAVARKGGAATTTLHYTRPDGSTLYEVTKEYGSDLCGLEAAIKIARAMLNPETEGAF